MFEYALIFILLLSLSILFDVLKRGNDQYTFFIGIALGVLILMGGLRNGVGSDTHNYASFFNNAPTLIELITEEDSINLFSQPLWLIINSTVKSLWDNFLALQILHALVFNILLVRFLKNTTKYVFSSLLVIYCVIWWNLSFEVMRESICVVLLLNSLQDLKEGRIRSYFLWNIPSVFIHWFSLPIILLVLICKYIPFRLWAICIISGIAVFIFIDSSVISSIIIQLAVFSGESAEKHILEYLSEDSLYGFSGLNIFGLLHRTLLVTPYILIIYYLSQTWDKKKTLLLNILLTYIFFFFIGGELVILGRYLNYLTPIAIVTLVECIYLFSYKKRSAITALFLIMVISSIYSGYRNFIRPTSYQDPDGVNYYHIPYTSIFEVQETQRENINY